MLSDVVIQRHSGATDKIVEDTIMKYLKYAPQRPGDGQETYIGFMLAD